VQPHFRPSTLINALLDRAFGSALPPDVRKNMLIELNSSIAYGVFTAACIQFIPVVLRRLGASTDQLALYSAQTYFGAILTTFSVMLIGQRQPKGFVLFFWTIARSLFLLFALINDVRWALLLTAIFWAFESFPSPAYTRMVQILYPNQIRGQVISIVRLGKAGAVLLIAPLAGWVLDHWGYQLLFPIASLLALLSTWIFGRMKVEERTSASNPIHAFADLWQIVRKNRPFTVHLWGVIFYGTGAMMGYALYPVVQVDRLNLSYGEVGWLSMAQSITWLVGLLIWGRTIDRKGALWTLRANYLAAFFVPLTYIWATSAWTLLPAFIAQGVVSAGVDMAFLNVCLQMAAPGKMLEYSALQSTVIGIRGIAASFLGAGMVRIGFPETTVFACGALLILISWWIIGQIRFMPQVDTIYVDKVYKG